MSTHRRKKDEVAVALSPELLAPYLQSQRMIHDELVVEDEWLSQLESATGAASDEQPLEDSLPSSKGVGARQEVMRSFRTVRREHTFKNRVLAAYGDRCAVCEVQLRLVESAHIVPVKENGADETRNGIALCSLHHAAYDRGAIGIWADYTVTVNEGQVASLQSEGLGGGLDEFCRGLRGTLRVPVHPGERPDPDLLARGLEVRGWTTQ